MMVDPTPSTPAQETVSKLPNQTRHPGQAGVRSQPEMRRVGLILLLANGFRPSPELRGSAESAKPDIVRATPHPDVLSPARFDTLANAGIHSLPWHPDSLEECFHRGRSFVPDIAQCEIPKNRRSLHLEDGFAAEVAQPPLVHVDGEAEAGDEGPASDAFSGAFSFELSSRAVE